MVHIVLTAYFAAMVVRDIVRPERDPVRSDGVPEHRDDPGGGVLDGAPDRWVLGRPRTTVEGVDAVLAAHAPPPRVD